MGGRNGRSEAAQRGAGGRPPKHSTGAPPDRPAERTNSRTPPSPSSPSSLCPLPARTPDLGLYCTNFCPRSLAQQAIPDRIRSELSLTLRLELRGYVNCGGDITVAERATAIENEGSKVSSGLPSISRRLRGKDASSLKLGKTPFPTLRICGAEQHGRQGERSQSVNMSMSAVHVFSSFGRGRPAQSGIVNQRVLSHEEAESERLI